MHQKYSCLYYMGTVFLELQISTFHALNLKLTNIEYEYILCYSEKISREIKLKLIAIHLYTYFLISVAMVCFPVAIAKSAIALLQGYLACINLGSVDVEERAQSARRRD